MGGASQATCSITTEGLLLRGNLVEQNGGFVSCRSPVISPPLNLSKFRGFEIHVEGSGRTLKFGVSCKKSLFGLEILTPNKIRWVAAIPTNEIGVTIIKVPFDSLEPAIRAKPVSLPVRFDPSCVSQLQLLHSKFGQPGMLNPRFKAGPIRILLKSINVYF